MNPLPDREQVVEIAARATAFTVVCGLCAGEDEARGGAGWGGASFGGRLDLDLDEGIFLCRRGHIVTIVRSASAAQPSATEAA
jgi:hypothetical protein